jgi:hypothetical protein
MRLIDADLFDNELVERAKKLFGEKFKTYEEIRAMLEAQPTVNPYEWISVEDRLPEKFVDVLCFYPSKNYGGNIEIDYMESDRGYFASQFKYGIPTHWMPLPKPPKD